MNKIINYINYERELSNLEYDLITSIINLRNNLKLSQKTLSELIGVKQPVIAKIEKGKHSPQINTILKILVPLGYTIKIEKIKR